MLHKKGSCLAAVVAMVLVVGATSAVRADTTTIPKAAISTSTIYHWGPDVNGSDEFAFIDYSFINAGFSRVVVKADLSALTGPVTINSALFTCGPRGSTGDYFRTFYWYRLTKDCNPSLVTWNSTGTGAAWTTPGGDLAATPTATSTDYNSLTTQLASDVQFFHDNPSQNFGWIILWGNDQPGANSSNAHDIPTAQLAIDFTPAPEPATMSLLALGCLGLLRRRR